MPAKLEQIRAQLSAIEPDEGTYDGIGSSDVPVLAQLLQDDEPWMAARAVFALSRVPDKSAVTILSKAVADPRQEVRVSLAASVGRLTPEEGSELLLRLLDDEDLGVRKFAVRSVAGTHDAPVHAKLRALGSQDPALPIREVAAEKLRELERGTL